MANEKQAIQKGRVIPDEITVSIGNQVFDGWQGVSVTKNLESIANQFSLSLFDKFEGLRADWPLKPGVPVAISINRDRVLTGRIEKLDVNYSDEDRSFTISGRSNPGDLVDCMHLGPTEYKNINLAKLAEELVAPFGIKVFLSVEPAIIDKFSIKPNETVFEALDRAARAQGFFFISTREGNIRLTRAGRARAATSLEQDVNILTATAVYDDAERFNEYIVKGQSSGLADLFGAAASQSEGRALDLGVKRYRPFVMIAESNADSAKAKIRAQWEASSRLAKAIALDVSVQGWTQSDGTLWGINQIIPTKSRFLGINRDMLITSVVHTDGVEEGKTTSLILADPQSYNLEPELNKKKKDDIFSSLGANF